MDHRQYAVPYTVVDAVRPRATRPPVHLLWHLLCLDPRESLRAGSGVRAALEGVAVMEAGAREPALPAMTELLRVDHLE